MLDDKITDWNELRSVNLNTTLLDPNIAAARALSATSGKPQKLTIASGGVIFAHNKVLLDKADSSDLWSIPGGVVRFDESPIEAAKRELKEELNLDVDIIDREPFIFSLNNDMPEYNELIILIHFLIKLIDPVKIRMGENIADYKWVSLGNNFRDCYPNVKSAVDYFMKI